MSPNIACGPFFLSPTLASNSMHVVPFNCIPLISYALFCPFYLFFFKSFSWGLFYLPFFEITNTIFIYSSPPYPQRVLSSNPSGYMKLQKVPNSIIYCFFSIFMYTPFHFKEALYEFFLMYLNCQHHYSCTFRSISK